MRLKLFLLSLLAVFMVTACTVPGVIKNAAEDAVATIGRGSDDATLTLTTASVTFDAGSSVAHNVALYLGGVGLLVTDERCEVVNNGVGCDLGTIEDSTAINYTGSDVSVNVSYYRDDVDTPLFFYVRLPD